MTASDPPSSPTPTLSELFGFGGHGVERLVGLRFEAIAVGEDVDELPAPVGGADHVMRDLARLDLLDEVRPAHVEQLGGLDRGQLGMQRDDRDLVCRPGDSPRSTPATPGSAQAVRSPLHWGRPAAVARCQSPPRRRTTALSTSGPRASGRTSSTSLMNPTASPSATNATSTSPDDDARQGRRPWRQHPTSRRRR